jgi:hypothetical protein
MLKLAPVAMTSGASATGWRVDLSFAHMMLAEVYAKAGQAKEALSRLTEAAECLAFWRARSVIARRGGDSRMARPKIQGPSGKG